MQRMLVDTLKYFAEYNVYYNELTSDEYGQDQDGLG